MAEKKKPRRRRAPADVAVASMVKMPLGELARFAVKLAKADEDVARYLLEALAEELPPPSTGAHGTGASPSLQQPGGLPGE